MTLPFRLRHADRIVGVFLLSAVAAVVVALFFVVKSQRLLQRRFLYRTVFSDGGGLKPASPVRIAGIEVGAVRAVRLTRDDKVEVTFDVLETYADRLRQDPAGPAGELCRSGKAASMMDTDDEKKAADDAKKKCGSRVAASVPAGLGAFLPSSGLVIQVGNRDNPQVEAGGTVPADEPEGLNELLARLQKEGVVQSARDIVVQVDELLRRINDEAGPVQQSLRHVEQVSARAAAGQGLVGEITRDGSKTQRQVEAALVKLDEGLLRLQQAADDVAKVTAGVRGREAEIQRFIDALDAFGADARAVGADLRAVAKDAKDIPPDVRATVKNLDERIDDLGAILKGLKKSFPLSLVVEEPADAGVATKETP